MSLATGDLAFNYLFTPYSLLVRMYVSTATEENGTEVQKTPELPHDPAIPRLGIPPKETKILWGSLQRSRGGRPLLPQKAVKLVIVIIPFRKKSSLQSLADG